MPNGEQHNPQQIEIDHEDSYEYTYIEHGAQQIEYLNLGLSIVPLYAGGKYPPKDFKWTPYQHKRLTKEEAIEIWTKNPEFGTGLVPCKLSGVFTVDFDTKGATDAFEARCISEGYDLSKVPAISSGSAEPHKGHLLFKYPSNIEVGKSDIYIDGHRIEIKGTGCLSVLPPSFTTHTYEWVYGRSIFNLSAPDAPRWLLEEVDKKQCHRPTDEDSMVWKGMDSPLSFDEIENIENVCTKLKYYKEHPCEQSYQIYFAGIDQYLTLGNREAAHAFANGYRNPDKGCEYSREETDKLLDVLQKSRYEKGVKVQTCKNFDCDYTCGELVNSPAALRNRNEFLSAVRKRLNDELMEMGAITRPSVFELRDFEVVHDNSADGAEVDQDPHRKLYYTIEDLQKIRPTPLPPIMEGVWNKHQEFMIFGEQGVGKSTLLLNFFFCLALGRKFFYWRIQDIHRILLIQSENDIDTSMKILNGMLEKLPQCDRELVKERIAILKAGEEDIKTVGTFEDSQLRTNIINAARRHNADIVAVDVISSYYPQGFNENSNADVCNILKAVSGTVSSFGATPIIVHHPARSSDKPRGASAWESFVRVLLFLEDDEDNETLNRVKIAHWEKVSSYVRPEHFYFEIKADYTVEAFEKENEVTITTIEKILNNNEGCSIKFAAKKVLAKLEKAVTKKSMRQHERYIRHLIKTGQIIAVQPTKQGGACRLYTKDQARGCVDQYDPDQVQETV